MKTTTALLILFLISNYLHAQYWIVGDTVGRKQVFMEQTFEPNTAVSFDIDCDGEEDLNIYSDMGTQISDGSYKWPVLHFRMKKDVEVLHDFGTIRRYEVSDTLLYENSLWTSLLDYIYGIGGGGGYGQIIDDKFIAYRKNTIDTAYCFIRFSNGGLNGIGYTIHEIISDCDNNPINIVATAIDKFEESEQEIITDSLTLIYPNPAINQIAIIGIGIKELVFYNNIGRKIFQIPYTRNINT